MSNASRRFTQLTLKRRVVEELADCKLAAHHDDDQDVAGRGVAFEVRDLTWHPRDRSLVSRSVR